jgi:hypothetical protein
MCLDRSLIGFERLNLFKSSQRTILTKIGLVADMVKNASQLSPLADHFVQNKCYASQHTAV